MLPGNTMKNRWVGTKNVQHLQDNIAAAKRGALPPDVFEEAKRRLAEAGSMPAQ
jgi:aryl-alcohol dehydrogenase-like predicted oxidoreductase